MAKDRLDGSCRLVSGKAHELEMLLHGKGVTSRACWTGGRIIERIAVTDGDSLLS